MNAGGFSLLRLLRGAVACQQIDGETLRFEVVECGYTCKSEADIQIDGRRRLQAARADVEADELETGFKEPGRARGIVDAHSSGNGEHGDKRAFHRNRALVLKRQRATHG